MKIYFEKKISDPEKYIRRCGYGKIQDRRNGQASYAKRLSGAGFYPRFHIYILLEGERVVYNLHLDQKRPIYEGVTAHSGEYNGEVVEREAGRIQAEIQRQIDLE